MSIKNMSKKLYLTVLYATDNDGITTDILDPEWVVETSEDRAKIKAMGAKINDTKKYWHVKIMETTHF